MSLLSLPSLFIGCFCMSLQNYKCLLSKQTREKKPQYTSITGQSQYTALGYKHALALPEPSSTIFTCGEKAAGCVSSDLSAWLQRHVTRSGPSQLLIRCAVRTPKARHTEDSVQVKNDGRSIFLPSWCVLGQHEVSGVTLLTFREGWPSFPKFKR